MKRRTYPISRIPEYIYGPVPSRRLGLSLGVDIVPRKVCTFDCVYCQLGKTSLKTIRRFRSLDRRRFERALVAALARSPKPECVTIAGSGEPTLSRDIGTCIRIIKKHTRLPVVLITNASLFYRSEAVEQVTEADSIIPSLDAASERAFRRVNRPHKGIGLDAVIKGLIELRRRFSGKIFLEVMLVKGVNDSVRDAERLAAVIPRIRPDKVQLTFPERSPRRRELSPSPLAVRRFAGVLKGTVPRVEIVGLSLHPRKEIRSRRDEDAAPQIISLLKRRPATFEDLEEATGLPVARLARLLRDISKKYILERRSGYFRIIPGRAT